MKVSVLAVGDQQQYELFFRTCCDYLKKETAALGYDWDEPVLLPVDAPALYAALEQAAKTSAVVIVLQSQEPAAARTVAETCAKGLGMDTARDETRLAALQNHARRTGRSFTDAELGDFLLAPRGATPIPNPGGFAQGWSIAAPRQAMLALPAVPTELSALFAAQVRPLLSALGGNATVRYAVARVADIDDIHVEETLSALARGNNPKVSWSSESGDYEIYIEASGATEQEAEQLKNNTLETLRRQFGVYYYGEGRQSLQEIVVRRYAQAGKRIATAESCTGGLLSERITEVSGSSRVFEFGISAYANRVKIEKLGVPRSFIEDYGAISRRTAAAMAVGARRCGKADVGVGITGNAGPAADEDKPVGLVYVSLADAKTVWVKKLEIQRPGADRDYIRSIAALQALNMLRLYAASEGAMPGGLPVSQLMSPAQTLLGRFTRTKQTEKPAVRHPAEPAAEHQKTTALSATKQIRQTRNETNPGKEAQSMKKPEQADVIAAAGKTNLIQRIRRKQMTKNDKIRLGALGLCLLVFIGCIVYIVGVKMESVNTKKAYDDLASSYKGGEATQEELDALPEGYLAKFAALYAQNDDLAGWLEIAGTQLDYAVVQYNNNDYYSRRDFSGATNQHGVPFVDYRCDIETPSSNLIIYGHNMGDGQMFGELQGYRKIAYYREHPTISFDSVYREGTYKIFGVVICRADDPDFLYHNQIEMDDEELADYAAAIAKRTLINTTVDVQPGDKLLTLSTCDYSFRKENGEHVARLVIFARALREGEIADVDTASAVLNPNPEMPQEWYDYVKKLQEEAELKAAEEAAAALANAAVSKWLDETEIASMTTEAALALAQQRQARADLYLTTNEQNDAETTLEEKLEMMDYRERFFRAFLSEEDRARESVRSKLSVANENYAYYVALLGESVVNNITKWEDLQALIANFKHVENATLSYNEVAVGGSVNPLLTFGPEDAAFAKVEFALAGGEEFATINAATGVVKGLKPGKATIQVTITNTNNTTVTATATVTVKAVAIPVTGATIAGDAAVPEKGTLKLTLTLEPEGAAYKSIEWSSNHPELATVSGSKLTATVTGVAAGSATITAKITNEDGSVVTASHSVKVNAAAIAATGLTAKDVTVEAGKGGVIEINVVPKDATGYKLTSHILSGSEYIALSGDTITGIKAGSATVEIVLYNAADNKEIAKTTVAVTVKAAPVTPEEPSTISSESSSSESSSSESSSSESPSSESPSSESTSSEPSSSETPTDPEPSEEPQPPAEPIAENPAA